MISDVFVDLSFFFILAAGEKTGIKYIAVFKSWIGQMNLSSYVNNLNSSKYKGVYFNINSKITFVSQFHKQT